MTSDKSVSVDHKIEKMLKKGPIKIVQQDPVYILSSIFAVPKTESRYCLLLNLKNLNQYTYIEMVGLFLLKTKM